MQARKRFMENAANIARVFDYHQIRVVDFIIKNVVTYWRLIFLISIILNYLYIFKYVQINVTHLYSSF